MNAGVRTGGNARSLDVLVRRATVWLGPDDGTDTFWGSGFFVAPGWVLTCAHVLLGSTGDRLGPDGTRGLLVRGEHGTAHARTGYLAGPGRSLPEDDMALVRVLDGREDQPCVWLSDRCGMPFRVNVYGWVGGRAGTGPQLWNGLCEVTGAESPYGAMLGTAIEIPHGSSGGPVVDMETGAVAGIVKARRSNRYGGLAVVTTALRRFADAVPVGGERGLGPDPYRGLIRAHDRRHDPRRPAAGARGGHGAGPGAARAVRAGPGSARHGGPYRTGGSWATALRALRGDGEDAGAWSPEDHLTALALLAELPPPGHPALVEEHVEQVLGEEQLWQEPAAPRDWRDGHGWLYGSGVGDEVAFLHYLLSVAGECAGQDPERSAELRAWVSERALHVPPAQRALLERLVWMADQEAAHTHAVEEAAHPGTTHEEHGCADHVCADPAHEAPVREPGREPVRGGPGYAEPVAAEPVRAGPVRAEPGRGAGPWPGPDVTLREADTEDFGPVVTVELEPAHYPQGDGGSPGRGSPRFYWRIWTWTGDPGSVRAGERMETGQGATRQELPLQLGEPLRAAFARTDTAERRARLEVALPVEHFDIEAHLWRSALVTRGFRPAPEERQFGVHRQVVLRDVRRAAPPDRAWEKRWNAVLGGGLEALPVRAGRAADASPLHDESPGAVPVLCRTAAESAETLAEAVRAGYGLALWNWVGSHSEDCGTEQCARLHERGARLVRESRRATVLPEQLRVLRERISLGDTTADWAGHLALLYDDPQRPLPGTDATLDSP